jgi:hypothetical protein
MIEPFAKILLRLLQNLDIVLQSIAHMAENLSQLLLNELRIIVQGLAQLDTELVNLLLHDQ